MNLRKIGIFDSGIGGLTILKPLLTGFPADYLYLADTAFAPYGNKSSDCIKQRVSSIIEFFEHQQVDLIIIACHTASLFNVESSVSIIPILKQTRMMIPEKTHSSILATQLTISAQAFPPKEKVNLIACPDLAGLIEQHYPHSLDATIPYLEHIARQIPTHHSIILGCTHYALIADQLSSMVPTNPIIKPTCLTQRLKSFGSSLNTHAHVQFLQTGLDRSLAQKITAITGVITPEIHQISLIQRRSEKIQESPLDR